MGMATALRIMTLVSVLVVENIWLDSVLNFHHFLAGLQHIINLVDHLVLFV
jgi:uncharacterized protein YjlB